MAVLERLTKSQKDQIEAEQKRYNASVARAKKEGRDFDPLDDAPTPDVTSNDPVQKAIQNIWRGGKTNG